MALGCDALPDTEVDHFLPGSIGSCHTDEEEKVDLGRVGVFSHPVKP